MENKGHYGTQCRGCGAPKSKGTSLQQYPGEWKCSCNYSNFRFRKACRGCGKLKVLETSEEKKERQEAERKRAEERYEKYAEAVKEQKQKQEADDKAYDEKYNEVATRMGWPADCDPFDSDRWLDLM